MSQAGRVVMVTGAAGNLGRAVARTFAANGDRLALVDLHGDHLKAAFDEADGNLLLAPANLLRQEEANGVVEAALQRFGCIDVLCNIAGGFRMGEPVHETSDATWDFLFDLNSRTLLHAVRAVVPRMLASGSGKIVNVAAFSALKGLAQMGAYTASKAVVVRLTEAMSAELRTGGINVNCVLPTTLDTPDNRRAMPDADPTQWVVPDDLAQVIAFLASDAARGVHGASIPVTGRA